MCPSLENKLQQVNNWKLASTSHFKLMADLVQRTIILNLQTRAGSPGISNYLYLFLAYGWSNGDSSLTPASSKELLGDQLQIINENPILYEPKTWK